MPKIYKYGHGRIIMSLKLLHKMYFCLSLMLSSSGIKSSVNWLRVTCVTAARTNSPNRTIYSYGPNDLIRVSEFLTPILSLKYA